MAGRKSRFKGEKIGEPFLALPRSVLRSPLFTALSPYALKLLIDLGAQFQGNNNGDLSCAWVLMKPRGWRSEATLHKAKRELLASGFIHQTRQGKRPNTCSLFALTWFALNPSPKHDHGPGGYVKNAFQLKGPLLIVDALKNAGLTTPGEAGNP